jgi:hypothetical protein
MESFFFLEPVLVASGVDLETFKDINWNLLYRYHQDEFHMKHELRNGNLYIIGIATHNDEMRIQTSSMAIVYLLRDWNGIHSSSSIGVYDGGARAPDITLRAYMPTMPYRDRFGATSGECNCRPPAGLRGTCVNAVLFPFMQLCLKYTRALCRPGSCGRTCAYCSKAPRRRPRATP